MKKEIYTYFAYGSNLNKAQMRLRCPKAELVDTGIIKDYNLVFRRVADIEYAPCDGHDVPVGIWRITQDCLDALDIYEGYPSLYRREILEAESNRDWGTWQGITYLMNSKSYAMPSPDYYASIEQGYFDCDLELEPLQEALHNTLCEVSKSERNQWTRYLSA